MYKIKIAIMLLVFSISITSNCLNAQASLIAPKVVSTVPVNGGTGVATSQKIEIIFNKQIDRSKINRRTFVLKEEGTDKHLLGSMNYSKTNKRVSFQPRQPLTNDTQYIFRIKGDDRSGSNVRDLEGKAMKSDFVLSFRTGPNLDTSFISPTVIFTNPINGATGIEINSKIIASFDTTVNSNTVAFNLKQGGIAVPGTVSYSDRTAIFTPTNSLATNSLSTAMITTQVKDLAGNSLANDYLWSFTTGQDSDSISPQVQTVSPINSSTNIAINQNLSVDFSEALDPLTVNSTTFILAQGTTLIPSAINYSGTTASLHPTSSLAANTTYIATITTQVKDLAGNALASNYVWSFTTGANLNQNENVALKSSSNFAILAGSTVTNTGPTIINGNLGLSPGSAVTGFPPGSVNGIQHINDPTSAQAKLDLTQAYNDAAGRTLAPVTVSGNIGGQTLAPGLYKSTSTLAISAGDLTLDAQGDANAVFIFQVASGFTVTSGRQVILSGGALASNIYWQVGSSATIGTTAIFKGNILADQSITLETGATLDGRALTRIGAVSLDSNTITKP